MNRLLVGDNLNWPYTREIFPDVSIDRVYLAPPFNSNTDYYLHCDPTTSHYPKIILDGIFGAEHFRNEISAVQ